MMKKRILIILLLVTISAVMYISLFLQNSMTIDEKIEKVLSTAYSNDYESYAEDFEYKKIEKLEKKRLREVDSLFTEKGLHFIQRIRFMTHSGYFVRKYRCSTSIESFTLDMRETSDVNNKVCYYSIIVKIDFLDEINETMFTELTGTVSLYLEGNVWKIGTINENQFPFRDIDIEKSSD